MKFGLMLESVQAQQKSVEDHLDRLQAHTRGIDGIVREEIRRTLVEELQSVTAETDCAVAALQGLKRAANLRATLFSIGVTAASAACSSAAAWWVVPSQHEIASLRAERAALSADIARLNQEGARIDWRRCGAARRLCVRVDRQAPAYGRQADYSIVKGY